MVHVYLPSTPVCVCVCREKNNYIRNSSYGVTSFVTVDEYNTS